MSHFPSDSFRLGAANRDPEEEALGWVVRLTSGEVSDADQAEFDLWHDEPENAAAYEGALRLWSGLGPILVEQEALGWPSADPATRAVIGSRWPRLSRFAALAASFALLAFLTTQYFSVWQYDHVTRTAVEQGVPLADGSTMVMGPGTALKTDFADGARHVSLARGEAFFDVKHDASHPFVVSSGNGIVRVLGTAFSVRKQDSGDVTVTVSRGRVEVTSGSGKVFLTPDRQVTFGETGLGAVRAVDASLAMAWMRGRLIMENRPLSEVLSELDRYDSARIYLLNSEAGARRINAVIDLGRIDSWLTALASSQGLKVNRAGPVIILR